MPQDSLEGACEATEPPDEPTANFLDEADLDKVAAVVATSLTGVLSGCVNRTALKRAFRVDVEELLRTGVEGYLIQLDIRDKLWVVMPRTELAKRQEENINVLYQRAVLSLAYRIFCQREDIRNQHAVLLQLGLENVNAFFT